MTGVAMGGVATGGGAMTGDTQQGQAGQNEAGLVLYGNGLSRARIVRWLLEEIGCPYRMEPVDHRAPTRPAGFEAISPLGKVPVLRHGELVMTETPAICAYLADRFPQPGLAPAPGETRARGLYYQWLFFTAGPLEAATTNRRLGIEPAREGPSFVGHGGPSGGLERLVALVGEALTPGPCLLGERFTAADLYLAAGLDFNIRLGLVQPGRVLAAYVARLIERPAARRARQLDAAEIAQG